MKKFLVFVILAFSITGCIELNTQININPDGSGTVEETVLMGTEMVKMINEFMTGFASDTVKQEEFKLYKEEDLKNKVTEMGEGVKFVSGSEIKMENKEGYKVIYSFSDINKLKIDQSPDSKIPDDDSEGEIKEKKYVTFNFTKGDVSEVKIKMPLKNDDEEEEKEENESETENDSTFEKDLSEMKFFMKDLSISISVNVNGEITETNALHREGTTVTLFSLNFGELLNNTEKLKELSKINPNDIQELNEVVKDIPGVKIDINDPVVIKFR
ncbi:MAG TPA: hypothetical protein VLN45_11170 [Ignavibacteriaceae bacterium]|nr:hypothetical protein [Ignavibacteriaceae bacterium]